MFVYKIAAVCLQFFVYIFRCHVQSGGVYFLISHVLGSRRGTAIGIVYVMGQAIGKQNFCKQISEKLSKIKI